MDWVTAVWAMLIGGCVAMALSHLFVGMWQRRGAHLCFVVAAAAVIGIAVGELFMIRATSVEQFARAQQWTHLPILILVVALVAFVRLYFRTGRVWLGVAVCAVRFVSPIINLAFPPGLNFHEITALSHIHFLGETVSVPVAVISSWTLLGELSSLLLLVFVINASIRLWQRARPNDRGIHRFGNAARLPLCVSASVCLLLLTSFCAAGAESKRVLVVHSFGTVAPPFTTHSTAFEAELVKRMGNRVDLDEVSLDMARYAAPDMQEALVDYLEKRGANWKPDLVVPIGGPAGIFVAKFRHRLFLNIPVLYCSLDRRLLGPDAFDENTTFVGANYEVRGFAEDILQIAPDTKNIAIVIGATPLAQYWTESFRKRF